MPDGRRSANHPDSRSAAPWLAWVCFGVYAFLALESAVVAAVFRGPWVAMIAPAVVCMVEALAIWRSQLSPTRWGAGGEARVTSTGRRGVASPGR